MLRDIPLDRNDDFCGVSSQNGFNGRVSLNHNEFSLWGFPHRNTYEGSFRFLYEYTDLIYSSLFGHSPRTQQRTVHAQFCLISQTRQMEGQYQVLGNSAPPIDLCRVTGMANLTQSVKDRG
jgi:hypothetical protein